MSRQPNPYAPPGADLGAPPPPEKGTAFKAVLFGFLVDVGLTLVLGLVFAVLYAVYQAATGKSMEEIGQLVGAPEPDSLLTIVLLGTGGACSTLGGFVCARVARHSEYRLGAVLAVISLVFGWVLSGDEQPATLGLISAVITILATMFGAWVGAWRNRRTG
jgi:hypothetical protein